MYLIRGFFLVVIILYLGINNYHAQDQENNFSQELVLENSLDHQNCIHDCNWDGDDVLSESSLSDLADVVIITRYSLLLTENPTLFAYCIWQPPKSF